MIGVGYEGRSLPEVISSMRAAGVTRLVDVRLTAISRKAGFSKGHCPRRSSRQGSHTTR